jgi:exopolysaccharide production protein ExoZ
MDVSQRQGSRTAPAGDPQQQIIVIQYLRGVAAALVVLYHTTMMSAVAPLFPIHIGKFGVDIFFVVSGFVMWSTTAGQSRRPLAFWKARIARIVPLYWIVTTLFVATLLLAPGATINARVLDFGHIVKSYLLIPAVDPGVGGIAPIYSIGWTLQFEMFFYAVFGLCLLIGSLRARGWALLVAFVGLVVAGLVTRPDDPILVTYTSPLLLEFLAGVGIAMLQERLLRLGHWRGGALIASGVALIALSLGLSGHAEIAATGTGCALLVAGALAFEAAARARPLRLFKLIGDASYSMYLIHPFFQRAAFTALLPLLRGVPQTPVELAVYAVVVFAAGIVGGIVTYYLVERPITRWLKPKRQSVRLAPIAAR